MQKHKLGRNGLEVSAIGLGCMGMSFSYGPPKDKREMIALLRSAVDRDLRDIDHAASKISIQGARLPEAVLKYSNR